MDFARVIYLKVGVAVVVVLAIVYALDFTRRRHLLEKIGHAPQLVRMTASVSRGRRVLKAVLVVVGVALVSVALAGPRVEGEAHWKRRGIDVAVVMDFSKSMLSDDVYPDRISRARELADTLLANDAFVGDRVAIVAFAGGAVHYPLTSDYETAELLYHGLDPRDMAPGSDIGEAILTARCILLPDLKNDVDCREVRADRLQGRPEAQGHVTDRARAMVLFTDGEDTEGRARAEVERAASLGIQVYVVGLGTKHGGEIPEYDDDGNRVGSKLGPDGVKPYVTRLDEAALREIAKRGGGEDHYFHDDPRLRIDKDNVVVKGLVDALRHLKEGDADENLSKRKTEVYPWLLFPGFMVLLVEACLSDRRRRVQAPRREKVA